MMHCFLHQLLPLLLVSASIGTKSVAARVHREMWVARAGFKELHEKYPELVIVGFPCNQFLGQESVPSLPRLNAAYVGPIRVLQMLSL